jgi:hypothetical protein
MRHAKVFAACVRGQTGRRHAASDKIDENLLQLGGVD